MCLCVSSHINSHHVDISTEGINGYGASAYANDNSGEMSNVQTRIVGFPCFLLFPFRVSKVHRITKESLATTQSTDSPAATKIKKTRFNNGEKIFSVAAVSCRSMLTMLTMMPEIAMNSISCLMERKLTQCLDLFPPDIHSSQRPSYAENRLRWRT